MADELENATGGETIDTLPAKAVAVDEAPEPVADVTASDHAADSVPGFGGLRGAKAREDGLVPGSAEAEAANLLYARIRRFQDRKPGQEHPEERTLPAVMRKKFEDRRRLVVSDRQMAGQKPPTHLYRPQPVLPPLPASVPSGDAPAGDSQADHLDSVSVATADALELWRGTDLEPTLAELLANLEKLRRLKRERKLALTSFTKEAQAEILRDSAWNETSKKIISERGGRVIAKLLNGFGVSAAYKDELVLLSALTALLVSEISFEVRLTKQIAASNSQPQPPTENK